MVMAYMDWSGLGWSGVIWAWVRVRFEGRNFTATNGVVGIKPVVTYKRDGIFMELYRSCGTFWLH